MNGEQTPGWCGDALPTDRLGVIAGDLGEIVEESTDQRSRRLNTLLLWKIGDCASDLVADVAPKRHVYVGVTEIFEYNAGVRQARQRLSELLGDDVLVDPLG